MKFIGKVSALIGCLVLGFLLSYADGLALQDAHIERNTMLLNPNQRTAQIGKAATVILIVNADDGTIGNGSGFFVGRDLIVTSVHVLAGIHGKSYTSEVRSANQPTQYSIKGVVASDPEYDLVILRVEGKETAVLQLGNSDTVKLGEKVIAVGTHGNTNKDTLGRAIDGTISRIAATFFRVKATLLPGYSGGPVLNSTGEVIGISVEGGETKSSGYVIPSNRLKALLENISEREKSVEEWRAEPMIRAYALVNRGDAEKVLGSAQSAIAAYDAAIRLTPDFAAAYAKRGSAKYNLGDYKGAIKDYNAAIGTGLDYAAVYVNRGVAKRNVRHHQGAIKDYNTAIRLDPELAEVYKTRGEARSNLGNHSEATKDYDTAVYIKPDYAEAYYKRGCAKVEIGNVSEAKADLRTALKLAKWERDRVLMADIEGKLHLLK